MQGKCLLDPSDCPYAHGRQDKRSTPMFEASEVGVNSRSPMLPTRMDECWPDFLSARPASPLNVCYEESQMTGGPTGGDMIGIEEAWSSSSLYKRVVARKDTFVQTAPDVFDASHESSQLGCTQHPIVTVSL
eukprot:241231-Amphidinium_carterae.1